MRKLIQLSDRADDILPVFRSGRRQNAHRHLRPPIFPGRECLAKTLDLHDRSLVSVVASGCRVARNSALYLIVPRSLATNDGAEGNRYVLGASVTKPWSAGTSCDGGWIEKGTYLDS